jgi:MerR family transcriptional regulator, light-induced transcriptional regulator
MYNWRLFIDLATDTHMAQSLGTPSSVEGLLADDLLPIREVSRITGVNPITLRAWERRYGLIAPTRTEGGHRLYSCADVETIRSIMGWIERGVAVSKVGRILAATRDQDARTRGPRGVIDSAGHRAWQDRLRQAASDFNETLLDQLLRQVLGAYPLAQAYEDVLMPVWHDFAARNESCGQVSEWLFFDAYLRTRTLQRLQSACTDVARHVVLTSLPGSCVELELWVAALLMSTPQTLITVLAPGQPLEELNLVCSKIRPDALVLFSHQKPASELPRRLIKLGLGLGCPMVLAGELADMAQDDLKGSPIACLGSNGLLMRERLQRFLAGKLDT